jgi:hypothetical protein
VTRYEERQRFRQGWLWALLLVSSVPASVLAVVAVLSVGEGVVWIGIILVLTVFPLILLFVAELRVTVREDGLALRLWPLHLTERTIPCGEITSVRRVDISPMGDFGGVGIRMNPTLYRWGVRFDGPLGYIVSGDEGVRIERENDGDIVLTSTDPRALRTALKQACEPVS